MNKKFGFDFENETIVCSKKALKAASNPTSAEYKELMKMKRLQPTFKVVAREITKNENKNNYKGLTLTLLEAYIEDCIEPINVKEAMMAELKEHKANGGYPLVKKWWCENFNHISVAKMKNSVEKKHREGIKTKVKLTAVPANSTEQKKAVGQN